MDDKHDWFRVQTMVYARSPSGRRYEVAVVHRRPGHTEEAERRAQLMATAPELLAALERLIGLIDMDRAEPIRSAVAEARAVAERARLK